MNLNKTQTKRWIKWIEALESGEYKRASGRLCKLDGTMCCLGVAYNDFFEGDWELLEDDDIYGIKDTREGGAVRLRSGVVGDRLQSLMGFTDHHGFTLGDSITIINDISNKEDYSEVIPHIEEYLKIYGNPEVLQRNPRYATIESQ